MSTASKAVSNLWSPSTRWLNATSTTPFSVIVSFASKLR
jgi:hypothetical protein